MLRRRVVALCLILMFALGTGSAFAATVVSNEPSEMLLRMTARANETITMLTERTQETGDRIVNLYEAGHMSYAVADATLQILCRTLRLTTDAIIAPVIAQAEREGITWDLEYEAVAIGWRTVMIDPIIVPGNSD